MLTLAVRKGQERPDGRARVLTTAVWALALPILFAEIGENIIFVTDTAFLGRVGTPELAAIALGDTVVELLIVPALGLVDAMQMVIARRTGEGRDEDVGPIFNRGLVLVALVACVLGAALWLVSGTGGQALTHSGAVAHALDDFLRPASLGLVFMALNFAVSALFVGLGRARALIGATLVLALTNLALSWVLILGELGAPRLGMRGAGWAFVGAEVAAFVYMVAYALRRLEPRRYGLFRLRGVGAPVVRPLIRRASPVALQFAVEAGRWFAFFLILGRVSDHALALASIVYACYAVLVIPAMAFTEAAYSLVSNLIGQRRADRLGELMRRVVGGAYLVTLPLVVVALLWPDTVLSVFTSDQAAIEGARRALQVAALALTAVVPAYVWLGALNGTGDTDVGFFSELLWSTLMLGFTAVAALQLHLRLEYIWMSLPAAALVSLVVSHRWVRSGRWRRRPV